MNTMAMASELADAGIDARGSRLVEAPHTAPLMGEDDDAHVVAEEAHWRSWEPEYSEEDRARDEAAVAAWDHAVATGTLPDGASSLEDFGYVGPY